MKGLHHYVIEDGKPVEVDTSTTAGLIRWAENFEGTDRRVRFARLTPKVEVSTVFLGLDHGFLESGPPVLWETMIFGGPLDQEQWRYTSREDAEKGHAFAEARARRAIWQRLRKKKRWAMPGKPGSTVS